MSPTTPTAQADVQQLKASLEDWVRRIQIESTLPLDASLMQAAFDDSPVAMSLSTLQDGKLLRVNQEWMALTGFTSAEVVGRHVSDLGLWSDKRTQQATIDKVYRNGRVHDLEIPMVFKHGVAKVIRWSGAIIMLSGQQHLLVSLQDVTQEKELAKALASQLALIHRVAERTPDMLFQLIQGAQGVISMPYASPAVEAIFGVKAEALVQSAAQLFDLVHPQDLAALKLSLLEAAAHGAVWRHEFRIHHADKRIRWLRGNASVYREDLQYLQAYGSLTDITHLKATEESNLRLAFYDQLTDLPNRRLMIDRIRQAQIISARTQRHAALMFLDLDNFKTINDTLGHDAGDEMLIEVARRLSQAVREGDTASRFGGDEFVVMIENLSDLEGVAVYQAEQVAMKILTRLNESMVLADKTNLPAASMGVVLFRGQATPLDDLLKHADMAMYQAKAAGRNTLRFFDEAMQSSVLARAALKVDINRALQNNEFVLYYQPMMDTHKQIIGYEAYVRWNHPVRGFLQPSEFMDMGQANPLVMPINDWALRAACEQLGLWATQASTRGLNLSVNISPCALEQPDFADHVARVLRDTRANPYRLTLEFKEFQPGQTEKLLGKMLALRELGVRFAMDDFGTGYTPLNLLKQLPLAQVKISRSFVQNVNRNPDDANMVRTMLSLAQNMDLMALTEGVETFEQYDKLSSYGCELFQGFLFGRPEPLSHWGLEAANANSASAVA